MEKDFDTAINNAHEKYAKMDGIENITVMTLTHNTDFSSLLNLVDDAEAFINCAKQIAKHCEWSPLFMGEHNAYLVVEKSNDGVVGGEFIVARTKPEALEEFTDGYLYRREGEAHKVTPQSLVKKLSDLTLKWHNYLDRHPEKRGLPNINKETIDRIKIDIEQQKEFVYLHYATALTYELQIYEVAKEISQFLNYNGKVKDGYILRFMSY